jgi:hypothetical protein
VRKTGKYGIATGTAALLIGIGAGTAGANGAGFVNTYRATIGHDVCQRPGVRWVEGLLPASPAYPFHPNRLGQHATARQVLAALGRQA